MLLRKKKPHVSYNAVKPEVYFAKSKYKQILGRVQRDAVMQNGIAWQDVLEGDEVERFLKSFVLTAAERKQLAKSAPDADLSALPSSVAQVQKDVSDIWRHKGFLTPAELKSELIQKYMPGKDPIMGAFVTAIEFSRNKPEAVTGYLTKEHAYLATGLAHLYALDSGMPMAMVEVDFSNMGGTNAYFRDLLAREERVMPDEIEPRRAELMTDKAMRLLSASMTDVICKELPEERVIPIRTGGDELRILVTGLGDYADIAALTNKLHGTIEKHVAGMGLQDHKHFKAPDDPARNGFGAALHIQDMATIENPQTIIQELDGLISANKQLLGLMRLGKIDEEAVEAEIAGKIMLGDIVVPQDAIEQAISAEVDKAKVMAEQVAHDLHRRNPAYNAALKGGVAGFHAYVDQAMPASNAPLFRYGDVPAVLADHPLGGDHRPEGVAPLATMETRYMVLSARYLASRNVTVDAGHRHLLRMSVAGLTPEDPSAKVMMPQGMVKIIDNIAADNNDFKAQLDLGDDNVKRAMADAGIKSVDDVKPYGLGVSFHNLAGLNNALGHHNADLVLRHMGQHIIAGALEHAGIPTHDNAAAIAHHGGGNFSVLLYPGGMDDGGKPWFVSPALLNKARVEIKKRVSELNNTGISDFLLKNDVYVNAAMEAYFENEGLKTFANIEDPKTRSYETSTGDVAYKVNGLQAVISTGAVAFDDAGKPAISGGAFIGQLRNDADEKIEKMRLHMFLSGRAQTVAQTDGVAVVQDYTMAFNDTARAIRHTATMDRGLMPDQSVRREGSRFRFQKPPGQKG